MCAALPLILPYLAKKRRLDRECFGFAPPPPKGDAPTVWLHAVSVGEAAAAEGVIRFLRERNCRLVLTHTTAAGGGRLRARHGEYARVCRLPLDFPAAAARFLRRVRPHLAVFMEAEYWPNLFAAMRAAEVPLLLANARFGRESARRRSRFAPLMRETAAAISVAAAQTRADARRLKLFGVRRTVVAGNLKFDRTANSAQIRTGKEWRKNRTEKPILLISGSRPGEEELLLREFAGDFLRRFFVILAPRHPERGDEIAALLTKNKIVFNRRADGQTPDPRNTGMHLADTLGEMDAFYACCDVALICGSFLPFGGQNPIEAMAAGVAAVIGPHAENYRALVAESIRCGALRQAKDAKDARRRIFALAENDDLRARQTRAARRLCETHRGALRTHTDLAARLLHIPAADGV
ncbi:MAG: 3-deoxy-D-manno-octulosonic acid transferase [Gammaproteobacteria bacterium]